MTAITPAQSGVPSQHAPTLNDANQDHHDGNYQKDVDEPAHRVRSDEAEKPKDDQDDRNRL
jgi:hypothetical protein